MARKEKREENMTGMGERKTGVNYSIPAEIDEEEEKNKFSEQFEEDEFE